MWQVALIAALLGALVSGVISFFVRRALDAKATREAERKLAYVVLVRISGLIAIEKLARRLFTEKFAALRGPDSDNVSHRISALIAELLSASVATEIVKHPQFQTFPRIVRRQLEQTKESRFSLEQLSKLPRPAVVALMEYQDANLQVCDVAQLWADYFEHGERAWVTPVGVHGHWRAIERCLDRAYNARQMLIEYGAATGAEADALLKTQMKHFEMLTIEQATDKSKLAAAASKAK